MRQRVLLAAALLDDPEIVILDEPTSGLDPEERIKIRDHIAEIAKGRTILLATHVVSDIECIAEKVLLLSHGKLIKFDTPGALIESIGDELNTDASVRVSDRATLEDVYPYYAEHERGERRV